MPVADKIQNTVQSIWSWRVVDTLAGIGITVALAIIIYLLAKYIGGIVAALIPILHTVTRIFELSNSVIVQLESLIRNAELRLPLVNPKIPSLDQVNAANRPAVPKKIYVPGTLGGIYIPTAGGDTDLYADDRPTKPSTNPSTPNKTF